MTHVSLEGGAIAPIGVLRRLRQTQAPCEPACEPGVAGGAGSPATEDYTGVSVPALRQDRLSVLVREPCGIVVCPPGASCVAPALLNSVSLLP